MRWRYLGFGLVMGAAAVGSAQTTTLDGASLTLRSSGALAGSSWTLSENGYLGTYITLAAPGTVSFTINASGLAGGGASPRMNLVVNDAKIGWDVGATTSAYQTSLSLPAGTHFVRTEFTNDIASADRRLTVASLQIGGATVSNTNSNTNALAAANTYIEHYRKGSAAVALTGPGGIPLLAGTPLAVDLERHAFNFGGAISGHTLSGVNTYLADNPSPGSTAARTQQFINSHFNMLAPTNAGKWANNESTRDAVNLSGSDKVLTYAQAHNMRARMHNLIWGDNSFNGQQPSWVLNDNNTGLLDLALAGNVTAKNELRAEITERIQAYVNSTRANRYSEIDVYNESVHTPAYWNAYGAAGVASIYTEVAQAAQAAGAPVKVMPNEYNVFHWGDAFGNWYRRHIEEMTSAGGIVSGIGTQYYVETNANANTNSPRSASKIMSVMQGLSVLGLPISLTEYGHQKGGTGNLAHSSDLNLHADILEESLRMVFGTPQAASFVIWGWWGGASDNLNGNVALVDSAWNLTPVGVRYESLMSQWDTSLTTEVDIDGAIRFTGFFGDYRIGNQSAALLLAKGTSQYGASLAAPPTWSFWAGGASGNWQTPANWTQGMPDASGEAAHFGQASGSANIAVASPVTVGMINFDSTGAYAVGGSTITLAGLAGQVAVNVARGSHSISAPLIINGDLTLRTLSPDSALSISTDLVAEDRSLTKTGLGLAEVRRIRMASLDLPEGVLRLAPKLAGEVAGAASALQSLSIASGAMLDLTNNRLTVETDPNLDGIRAMLASAKLVNSAADAAHRLGYMGVSGGGVQIELALAGDANLDGIVDITDLGQLASAWQGSGHWPGGDFDYNGVIDISDLGLLASNWQQGAFGALDASLVALGLPGVSVPEPGSMPGIGATVVYLLGLRRRRLHSHRSYRETSRGSIIP